MWLAFALGSALFAGLTAILAKIGIEDTDSHLATAIRTAVVLAFSWLLVFLTGAQKGLALLDGKTLLFLVLSGLATGASWLCYFRALHLGTVSRVAPIDKSSTVLTMLLAFLFLSEPLTGWTAAGMALMTAGTLLMAGKREPGPSGSRGWLAFALLSALFASLTALLGKIGIQHVDSNLGTAIRTSVVLVLAWGIVFATGRQRQISAISRRSWLFLLLSGVTTGLSWLCYFRALQDGPASVVVPIDKLSILPTVAFSALFLKERLPPRAIGGLVLVTGGTLLLLVK